MDKIHNGTWVVVADGTQARMLRNEGEHNKISLKQVDLLESKNMPGQGPSGSRPPEESISSTEEATFAKQLAHHINDAALKNQFKHLVLIADPQTLGQMRPLLHHETTQRMIGELAKTLTNAPIADIEKSLKAD